MLDLAQQFVEETVKDYSLHIFIVPDLVLQALIPLGLVSCTLCN